MALEIQGRRRRDKISLGNPADSGLVAENRENSIGTRVRGGAERTRTSNQAVMTELAALIAKKQAAQKIQGHAEYGPLPKTNVAIGVSPPGGRPA